MNKFYLYISKEDELGEIIEKIKKAKGREVVLVIPEKTKSLSHPANLEIFRREIKDLDKKIYLSTTDEKIKTLARNLNLPIFLEETEEKIFDIKPPKKKEEQEEQEEQIITQSKPKLTFNFIKIFSYIFILIVISLFTFILFQILQTKAEIIIETKKTTLDIDEVISLKENQVSPDYENKVLPGEFVKVEILSTETVTTTGPVGEESQFLKVIFYNYLERDIPLAMGTRLSYNDNIFRTTEKIVIPSAQNNEPGKKSVTAILSSLKDENLKIPQGSDLKIVAWEEKKTKTEDGRLFIDVVKAKVEEDYNYGSMVKIGSVAPQDITNVKLKLEDSLKKAVHSDLAFKNPQSFYIFEPALVKIEIQNISHQVGEKTNKIFATGKATYETMKTSKKEFDDFIKNLINKEILKENKNLIISQLQIEENKFLDFDSRKKIVTVGIKGKAILVPDLNPETLKSVLKGKTIEEAKEAFKIPGVEKVTIRLFPQWKEKLPEDPTKIKILIR
jgi:hypothetical protein